MPTVLKISDYDGRGVLAFDIKHLLPLVATIGADLNWHVIPAGETTWLLAKTTALKETQKFSELIEASDLGFEITWSELLELAESVTQCVWLTVIAVQSDTPWPGVNDIFSDNSRYIDRALPTFYESVEIALQAVDSSFWLVYGRDAEVREQIRTAFDDVEVIEVGAGGGLEEVSKSLD